MVNTEPKRHHYLPRFYLEGFSKKNCFWVFDRIKNEVRKQTPESTAVQIDYYTATVKGAQYRDIEKYFAELEGRTKPIISKIMQSETITSEDKETLSMFISFLRVRVPDFEKMVNEMSEKAIKWKNQFSCASTGQAEAMIREFERDTGKKLNLAPQKLYEVIREGKYSLKFKREWSLLNMLSVGIRQAQYFRVMNWAFLRAPQDSAFITSDTPFLLAPPKNHDPKPLLAGVGITTHNATKYTPLNSEVCIMMGNPGDVIVEKNVDKETVQWINCSIAENTDRFVIASNKTQLEEIVKSTKIDEWQIESRVQVS